MADLPKGDERSWAIGVHKSFGLIAILLIIVRLAWRLGHPPPDNPALAGAERKLASAAHRLLYLLLVLVPAAGFTSVSFTSIHSGFRHSDTQAWLSGRSTKRSVQRHPRLSGMDAGHCRGDPRSRRHSPRPTARWHDPADAAFRPQPGIAGSA